MFLEQRGINGSLISTIAMPIEASGGNKPFTNSGSATTEGFITQSVQGPYLVLAGYATAPGLSSVATSSSSPVNRVVGRVDYSGTIDTSTAFDAYNASNIRSAVTFASAASIISAKQFITERVNDLEELGALKFQLRNCRNTNVFEKRRLKSGEDQGQLDHCGLQLDEEYNEAVASILCGQIIFGVINDAMSHLVAPPENSLQLILDILTNRSRPSKAVDELPKCYSAGFLLDVV